MKFYVTKTETEEIVGLYIKNALISKGSKDSQTRSCSKKQKYASMLTITKIGMSCQNLLKLKLNYLSMQIITEQKQCCPFSIS
jgi:hypothetical protein